MANSIFFPRPCTQTLRNLVLCSQVMDKQVDEKIEQRQAEQKQERDRERRMARLYTPQDPTVTASTEVSE